MIIRYLMVTYDLEDYADLISQLSGPNWATLSDEERINLRTFAYRIAADPKIFCWVLFKKGELIGTATLEVYPMLLHGGCLVGKIDNVVIDKRYRKKGYGEILVQKAIDKAKEQGAHKTILECSDFNVDFYKKCGFFECGNVMRINHG